MAAFDTSRPSVVFAGGRISNLFANAVAAIAEWNDARVTRNTLAKLSSHELEDIGLVPGDIDMIARHAKR